MRRPERTLVIWRSLTYASQNSVRPTLMFCVPVPQNRVEATKPIVVYGVALLDLFLLIPIVLGNSSAIITTYGFTPAHPTPLTFFGAMFPHVGVWHYLGNMWFFWIFG